ncbi:hypothetical protein AGMMS50256_17460 [Betaproteobacteria bacterium]|nr:hypothetical protein AGMMS50256_17460 [Betaproteobacteria bacterium]
MYDFLRPDPGAYANLQRRATGRCVRFRAQPMPPGAVPDQADIGFEVDANSGCATLLVQFDVQWFGAEPTVRQWFIDGQRQFVNFADLVAWVQGPLASSYGVNRKSASPASTNARQNHSSHTTATIPLPTTDLEDVQVRLLAESSQSQWLDADTLYQGMAARVIGQASALRTISSTVTRHLMRSAPQRPAVLFSVGPSGVGKTLSAEVLAELLTEHSPGQQRWRYLRLDMSEYAEEYRISQLLGSPQGYVGHGERSELVDALSSGDPGVLLFDEIEKAHPVIFKVLMNAMDAGRLSSASALPGGGHQLDCRRWVFIFTSNLCAEDILRDLSPESRNSTPEQETDVCRQHLRRAGLAPELVGRIGRFVVYRPIAAEQRVTLLLTMVREVAAEYGVTVGHVSPDVLARLLRKGNTTLSNYGSRAERVRVDELLGDTLAQARRQGQQHIDELSMPMVMCKTNNVSPSTGAQS